MTAAFAEFQRRAEEAGCEGQWLTEAHWQIRARCSVEFYPQSLVFFVGGQKFRGDADRAIAFAVQPPAIRVGRAA